MPVSLHYSLSKAGDKTYARDRQKQARLGFRGSAPMESEALKLFYTILNYVTNSLRLGYRGRLRAQFPTDLGSVTFRRSRCDR